LIIDLIFFKSIGIKTLPAKFCEVLMANACDFWNEI